MLKKILIFILFSFSITVFCFENLKDLESYTASHQEYVDPDNFDWLNPDYSSFYKKNLKGMLGKKILTFFGFRKKLWSANKFQSLLTELVEKNEKNSFQGNYVQKFAPSTDSKFIIWGNLEGAFHSLVRDLLRLKDLGIIDTNLKIHGNHYFIFNGNVVGPSPYILETLTLVIKLMLVNPEKVFYIKGELENKENWHGTSLERELKIRAHSLSKEKIPLNTLIKRFFMTLPLSLYLQSKDGDYVRISHYGREEETLNEAFYSDFLLNNKSSKIFKLINRRKTSKAVDIKVIIKDLMIKNKYTVTDGLLFLPKDEGAVTWQITSSPTSTYRVKYEFFNDAFCILSTKSKFNDWEIVLNFQDVRTFRGFKIKKYNLLSGNLILDKKSDIKEDPEISKLEEIIAKLKGQIKQLEEKKIVVTPSTLVDAKKTEVAPNIVLVEEKKIEVVKSSKEEKPEQDDSAKGDIVIGCSLWLSEKGGLSPSLNSGMTLRINKANKEGGINGKRLKVIFLDDEYSPDKARSNIITFLTKYKTNIILSPNGSSTLLAYLDMVKGKKVLVAFPVTGAGDFRIPEDHLVHLRASYPAEAKVLTEYAIKEKKAKKIVIFYQDDAYGRTGLMSAKKVLQDNNIKDWLEVSYIRKSANFINEAKKIKEYNPQAILFFATDKSGAALIRELEVHNLSSVALLGFSDFAISSFKNFIKERGVKFITAQVMPDFKTSNLPIVEEFRKESEKQNLSLDPFILEGYINVDFMIELLKKIKGEITKESIIKVINDIKDYDYKGLKLTLNPKTRELSSTLWIETDTGQWLEYVITDK